MSNEPVLALGWYRGFARRYLFVIADCALLGVIVTVVIILLSPLSYRGTANVVLSVLPTTSADVESAGRSLAIDIDAQLAESTVVLQVAADQVGFPGGATALAEALRLTARPNAHALRVRVSAQDRKMAMAAAEAICAELLRVREQTLAERLDARRTVLRQQLELVTARMSTPILGGERERLTEQLSSLQLTLAELEAQSSFPGFMTGSAAGSRGGRPGLQAKLASGAMLGVLLGIGLAAAIEGVRSARRHERRRQAVGPSQLAGRVGWEEPAHR
ncbi:MAG: hypothetical protein L0Y54_21770 [Sporichthyaceae bacterium]|nr:hypothetical protein [Sporichthyaceae bacterium]